MVPDSRTRVGVAGLGEETPDFGEPTPRHRQRLRRVLHLQPVMLLAVTIAFEAGNEIGVDQRLAMDAQELRRSEEHTSDLQSLMRISYDVFCLKNKQLHTQMSIQRNPRL